MEYPRDLQDSSNDYPDYSHYQDIYEDLDALLDIQEIIDFKLVLWLCPVFFILGNVLNILSVVVLSR